MRRTWEAKELECEISERRSITSKLWLIDLSIYQLDPAPKAEILRPDRKKQPLLLRKETALREKL